MSQGLREAMTVYPWGKDEWIRVTPPYYATTICDHCGHVSMGFGSTEEKAQADADEAFHQHCRRKVEEGIDRELS